MNEKDGIYLSDRWAASAEGIATTLVSNDLTKPTQLQSSFSNTVRLPDTISNRTLLGNAEQLDAGGPDPYRVLPASVIQGGETTFLGVAELDEFEGGWNATLFQEKRNLFDRVDRSIRTVDLGQYDHPWTVDAINALADSTDGVCYPCIDYGLLSKGVLPVETMAPAVYGHTVLKQLLHEEGYRLVGDVLVDRVFNSAVIPFSEEEPTSHDEQWKVDRYARVTVNTGEEEAIRGVLGSGSFINRIQTYPIDDQPEAGFTQGRLRNYNPKTGTYTADSSMRVRVEATQLLKMRNIYGSLEALLIVEKNGQAVGETQLSTGSGYNLLRMRTDKLSLDELVTCKKGDRLQIRLIVRRQTRTGDMWVNVYLDPENSFCSFTPDLTTQIGDQWLTSRNLPDMTGLALMKGLAFMMCGTWVVDAFRKEVSFSYLTSIVSNSAKAVDWSNRVDTGPEPKWVPLIEPYAQANYLKWKETEDTKALAVRPAGSPSALNYGDGIINVTASRLDTDTTLFEMPWGASINSDQSIPGYGNPVLVRTRTMTGIGDSVNISQKAAGPRLVLVSTAESFPVPAQRLGDDGVTVEYLTVKLKPCWFGARPDGVTDSDTKFSLCFSAVSGMKGEQCLIPRYYPGLERVLRRMRMATFMMRLWPEDIAGLDFERPILLQRIQPGSLVISQHFFYLNRISNYQDGRPCQVTLIAFDPINVPKEPGAPVTGPKISRAWIKDVGILNNNVRFHLVADATTAIEYYIVEDGNLATWAGPIIPVADAPTSANVGSQISRNPVSLYTPLTLKLRIVGKPETEITLSLILTAQGGVGWEQVYPA